MIRHALHATLALLAAFALSGCGALSVGSGRASSGPVLVDPVVGADEDGEVLRLGALTSRSLGAGQCGMFLWRKSDNPPLVFFFNSTTGRAAIVIDGSERALSRIEVVSPSSDAPYGEQVFASTGGSISVRLTVHEREPVSDGVRIARAVLRVADDQGWSVVVGVGGLAACQT